MRIVQRFWEIDALRGAAVFGMVIYHFLFDLRFFYLLDIPVFEGYLLIFARLIAIIFIFLVGASSAFSQIRRPLSTHLKHALTILLWSGVITLVTYLLFPKEFIYFGILQNNPSKQTGQSSSAKTSFFQKLKFPFMKKQQ